MTDTRVWDNRAWFFVIPVLVFVLFSSLLPMMTVVNYSVQDLMGRTTSSGTAPAGIRTCSILRPR